MKSSKVLKEERADVFNALETMTTAFEAIENPTETEVADFKKNFNAQNLLGKQLTTDINFQEEVEAQNKRNAIIKSGPKNPASPEQKVIKQFSFCKAIVARADGNPLSGIEAEMYQEAQNEAKEGSFSLEGNIAVPSFFVKPQGETQSGQARRLIHQTRDLSDASTYGVETISVDTQALVEYLKPELIALTLGARKMSLKGDAKFPRNDAIGDGNWEGEQDVTVESTPTFDSFTLSPNRYACFTDYSIQVLRQSTIGIEEFVRDDIVFATEKAVDTAYFNGSGSSNVPRGVLNVSGISDVAMGANGAAITWAKAVEYLTDLDTSNARNGTISWVGTPAVKGQMMTTEKASSTAQYIMGENGMSLLGYPFHMSNNLPTDLTKGTGTALHPLILGNWRDSIVAQWGGISLLVDPYSLATSATIRLHINSFWDFGWRHAASFAASQDIDVS